MRLMHIRTNKYFKHYFLWILLLVLCGSDTSGQQKKDSGHIVLTISWADSRTAPVKFELKDLEKMERKDYWTTLPPSLGVSGRHDWQGVPLRVALEAANVRDFSRLRITALDGYEVYLPAEDIKKFDPILAYRKDGQYIGILDKGPLFLIYPFDSSSKLQTMEYINRTIWQLNTIVVK
jgi:hypothetical protein